jgi:hypothetical protein
MRAARLGPRQMTKRGPRVVDRTGVIFRCCDIQGEESLLGGVGSSITGRVAAGANERV